MNPTWEIRQGNALYVLRRMPSESVHCVVTSPPYYGLRDYGLPPSVWGGGPSCDHRWDEQIVRHEHGTPGPNAQAGNTLRDTKPKKTQRGSYCACGAWQGSLGMEPTVELYIEHIVGMFREVRRVLRADGTVWLNLGDAYAGSGKASNADGTRTGGIKQPSNKGSLTSPVISKRMPRGKGRWGGGDSVVPSLKPKDLIGLPWRVAFALQTDGWWLRSDIVWAKPNPMPESVQDRPTRAHEYVFLLTKSGTTIYWTHRDLRGTRAAPEPDYRWTDQAMGSEYQTEPTEWSDELIGCPDCGGAGETRITVGQASLFDGPPTLVKVCSRCTTTERRRLDRFPVGSVSTSGRRMTTSTTRTRSGKRGTVFRRAGHMGQAGVPPVAADRWARLA